MNETDQLTQRTTDFASRMIRLFTALPTTGEAQVIGKEALDAGLSVAINHRMAERVRGQADFKERALKTLHAVEETDSWLKLLVDAKVIPPAKVYALRKETENLIQVFSEMSKTAFN